MIQYFRKPFGLNLLFRLNGSAVYRAMIPGMFSVAFLILIHYLWKEEELEHDELRHPYAVGVLVATVTFLLVFRTQQAYARYWEAASAVYHMMSKWMDAIIHTASYHMQCSHYNHIKPPSYFDHPELNKGFFTRARERQEVSPDSGSMPESERIVSRAVHKSIERVHSELVTKRERKRRFRTSPSGNRYDFSGGSEFDNSHPSPLEGMPRLDGGWSGLFDDGKATYFDPLHREKKDKRGFASCQGGRTAPLFLQELSHLGSLLTGVALSTLRNDIEGAESPLDIYEVGSPWPEVDPDSISFQTKRQTSKEKILTFLGVGRSPEERTRYNASRPLGVIGGVSEGEIRFLQMARGPYAKTQLCWHWLSEFVIREHLAGSTGAVGPPIISRISQFLGDGMIYYNHARKITFIPFPFPHAQLSAIYVLVMIPAVAFLMDQYTDQLWVGCVLTFLTVTALSGIHEVARELENPFRNVPNELPLVTLQAQFNEALITMYAGYHPDSYWTEEAEEYEEMSRAQEGKSSEVNEEKKPEPQSTANEVKESDDKAEQKDTEEKIQQLMKMVEQQALKMEQQDLEMERLRDLLSSTEEKKSDPVSAT